MYTRHNEVQQMQSSQGEVAALYYNHVQTALKRFDNQIRFEIIELKHLDLILQKDAWVIVDRVLNDIPILAWTDFEIHHRKSLHQPIKCKIRFYHFAASLILSKTLEAMELLLTEALSQFLSDNDASVIPFDKKSHDDKK